MVEAAKKFESALHKTDKEKKSANWLLKAAKDADLMLDENLETQIKETLGAAEKLTGKRKRHQKDEDDVIAPVDFLDESDHSRRKLKEISKVQQLKMKYDDLKKKENFKRFSNSSFLTPEAASYLNELVKAGQQKADLEIVYAG